MNEPKITTRRIGGGWHGYLEGHPEIDERALTEEAARRKVERLKERMEKDPALIEEIRRQWREGR